jgi:peptide-methionine (R)-S-oxide reductase
LTIILLTVHLLNPRPVASSWLSIKIIAKIKLLNLSDENYMNRRKFLTSAAVFAGAAGGSYYYLTKTPTMATSPTDFEITKTEAEWKSFLTPEQFNVLRKHGTERAGTSPLDKEHGKGTFACAGCDLSLFASETKFNSGTGWPSFYDPLPNAVGTSVDRSLFAKRTEVHCRRCGGHLGHVFEDGPKPTGLRYCMNGVSMKFISA